MSRVYSGSCSTTTEGLLRGDGSITIITHQEYPVSPNKRRSFPTTEFFSDLKGVDKMTFHFDLGTPFRPFEQLMGVLPEASKELIPPAYRVSFSFVVRLHSVGTIVSDTPLRNL